MQDGDRLHRSIVVLEGFTHSHDDDVSECTAALAGKPGGIDNLGDDFTGAEVADETSHAGGAEGATDRTADLAGHTDSGSVRIAHEDGFDMLTVDGTEEELFGFAVVAGDGARQLERCERQGFSQVLAQRFGEHRHGMIVKSELLVCPVEELSGSVGLVALRNQPLLQFGKREVMERGWALLAWSARAYGA